MLRRLWEAWKPIARKIGDFQARLMLGLFYFFLVGPFSIPVKFSDPLSIKKRSPQWWPRTEPEPDTIEKALRQS
jgi:hypothetical protein